MDSNWRPGGSPRKPKKIHHKKIRKVKNERGKFGYFECEVCGKKAFTLVELKEKSCY